MQKTYAILGSGMQGTAAAYDLAMFGDAERILMGDVSLEQSAHNAERVNRLAQKKVCESVQVDALDTKLLAEFLEPVDVLISCVPYWMHPRVAPVAIQTRTSMVDLGGNTNITWQTLAHHREAKEAGVSLVPDSGLAPGLVVSVAAYFKEIFDEVEDIHLYCGGLPQHPKPPFNYRLAFHIGGLLTEYTGQANVIRNKKLVKVDTLTELETIVTEELGELEAFITSGGTSTAPYSWEGEVSSFDYKTLRYPGHCEKMKLFKDCGFWGTEPVDVNGNTIMPQALFMKLISKVLSDPHDKDIVVVRGLARGTYQGKGQQHQIDLCEKFDEKTGFTAMERLTGYSAAIHAIEIAKGNVERGCIRYELSVPGQKFLTELQRRDIKVKFSKGFDL